MLQGPSTTFSSQFLDNIFTLYETHGFLLYVVSTLATTCS